MKYLKIFFLCLFNLSCVMEKDSFRKSELTKVDYSRFNSIVRVELNGQKPLSKVYTSLHAVLGKPTNVLSEGYEYIVQTNNTDKIFIVRFGQSGPYYLFVEEDRELVLKFEEIRSSIAPTECELKYKDDFGTTVVGYSDGDYL